MDKIMKSILEAGLALGLMLPATAAPGVPAGSRPEPGQNACGDAGDPHSLWECWRGGAGDRPLAAACVPKSACPARDQNGKPVLNCYYESDYKTGWRCILFCNYGGASPWGSDGGDNCD